MYPGKSHYNLFHPFGLIRCLELRLFICLFTFGKFWNLLEKGGRLEFEFGIEIELYLN